jgi:hypothetical protein
MTQKKQFKYLGRIFSCAEFTFEARSCNHFCTWNAKNYIICVCICSLRYPACYAHALYCHLWPVWLYNIHPHYLLNDTIFEETLLNIKCVLIFFTTNVCNFYHSMKNCARYGQTCILSFMWSTRYSWLILMNLNLLDRFLKNTQISIVMKIHPVWIVLFHADGKDRRGESNSRYT